MSKLEFIDLFCGIGGFRLAGEASGMECVFSSDYDVDVQAMYRELHGDLPEGDITQIDAEDIPSHDVLFGGFPCQAFSRAGDRKGFHDTRGTLFHEIIRIAEHHCPRAMLLENVQGLIEHDKGRTLEVILGELKRIGYFVEHRILDAKDFGAPCMRPRVFLVCTKEPIELRWPESFSESRGVYSYLQPNVSDKFTMNGKNIVRHLQEYLAENEEYEYPVFQYRRYYFRQYDNICPTMTANMGTGGHNVPFVRDPKTKVVRKLTPGECFSLMGFEDITDGFSNAKLYKAIGNSVAMQVVYPLVDRLVEQI